MQSVLRYGVDSAVPLEFAEDVLVGEFGHPDAPSLADPLQAAMDALAEPMDYPPLSRATTPADCVTIAVEEGVPQAGQLVAAVVRSLLNAHIPPDGITLLRTATDAALGASDPQSWLPAEVYRSISLVTHDPTRRGELAYVAAMDNGERVVLNRAIVDADLVVPIGCIRNPSAAGYHGVYGAIYPTFADRRTHERFHSPRAVNLQGRSKRQVIETVNHVGWLLGVMLTVQAVPGESDEILHVLCGNAGAVAARGRVLYDTAWQDRTPRRAGLVIAAIPGPPIEQTWENFGRALAAADALVEDDGLIAVCCDLEGEPGAAFKQLARAESRQEALRELRKEHSPDAQAAAQLAQTQDRAAVYLLSRLDPALVEDLEMTPIAEAKDVARLAQRHRSSIVLASAPRAMVMVEE